MRQVGEGGRTRGKGRDKGEGEGVTRKGRRVLEGKDVIQFIGRHCHLYHKSLFLAEFPSFVNLSCQTVVCDQWL